MKVDDTVDDDFRKAYYQSLIDEDWADEDARYESDWWGES